MMDHPNKRQKVEETTSYKEEILFNSDTLSKIISYLPSDDVLYLALTSKRFGISSDDELSVIKKSTHIAVHDIATEEQLAALPHYECESSLADYHYLQLMRAPLVFDQLTGGAEYANSGDKSCVTNKTYEWGTAFSNNILRAGKHYVAFEVSSTKREDDDIGALVGVMRPGKANQNTKGYPAKKEFFQNFSRKQVGCQNNNDIQCCLYYSHNGDCYSSDWEDSDNGGLSSTWDDGGLSSTWDGKEGFSSGDEIGMLLDLDVGTLSVYKNSRKLGVMKRGLAGAYCWAVSTYKGQQVTIKRGVYHQIEKIQWKRF